MSGRNSTIRAFRYLSCPEYQWLWQAEYSLKRKLNGIYSMHVSRRYVTTLRAMKRQLMAGEEPSFDACPSVSRYHHDFLHSRRDRRFLRAIERGESRRAMALRGHFGGPLMLIRFDREDRGLPSLP